VGVVSERVSGFECAWWVGGWASDKTGECGSVSGRTFCDIGCGGGGGGAWWRLPASGVAEKRGSVRVSRRVGCEGGVSGLWLGRSLSRSRAGVDYVDDVVHIPVEPRHDADRTSLVRRHRPCELISCSDARRCLALADTACIA
jgi:hypothetical protein